MNPIAIIKKNQELWDLFTRKEEYDFRIRDQYDRFPYSSGSGPDILDPKVSEYLNEHGYKVEYPENKSFAVCLTHDIDVLYQKKVTKCVAALDHFRNYHVLEAMHSLAEMSSKKLPWWNFSEIMALEDHFGAKSSFYFMVQDPGDRDYAYDIEDCEAIIREISEKGWEIGLHGGHTSYNDPADMTAKKQRIEKVLKNKVIGYRNHYLRFRVPDTWEHLRSAGFLYDTTFGYAEHIGFRNGMCYPFRPYNLNTQQEIDLLEIPLAIMDRSLDLYMKLDAHGSWEKAKQLIDTVAKCHGVCTLLWHNTNFTGDKKTLYEKILRYCAEKGAWMTSGKDICMWWQKNV